MEILSEICSEIKQLKQPIYVGSFEELEVVAHEYLLNGFIPFKAIIVCHHQRQFGYDIFNHNCTEIVERVVLCKDCLIYNQF